MSDVSEELVRRYFEQKGYLVRTNVRYQTRGGRGGRGGQWSDVDLCVLHPKSNDAAAVEVKGWNQREVTLADFNPQWGALNFVQPEALNAVAAILGREHFRRILVLPRVADQRVMNLAAQHEVEILGWPDILRLLVEGVHVNVPATNESENVIRLLKAHGEGAIFGVQLGMVG